MPSAPTLYLDHSVVSNEPMWPVLERILNSGKWRLVLSLWNLFEIGSATDAAQRERRLSFLEKFNPLWIVERVDAQREEVRRFLWKERFGISREFVVITPCLSIVNSYHSGSLTRVGLGPRQWIAGMDFDQFNPLKHAAQTTLARLQKVDKKTLRKREHEIFKPWIEALIPISDPQGKAFSAAQKTQLLNFCERHRKPFFAQCRSLAVEDALMDARISDPLRKPEQSDGIDLMHTVMALAYCDCFVVRDRFVHFCAMRTAKQLAPVKLALVYDDPAKLLKDTH